MANMRQIDITEAIESAESNLHIKAYKCHYCAHCDEYNGIQSPCELGINPSAHKEAQRCRKEFIPYEYYDRESQQNKVIAIPSEHFDKRYKK